MGGLKKYMPSTRWTYLIATFAIAGFPLVTAGFYSKDMIIEEAFAMGTQGLPFGLFAFWIGILAAGLTSFYSWRLIFMTFHGKHRGDPENLKHAHESGWVMLTPLILLAVGAVFAGAAFKSDFVGKGAQTFWGDSLPAGAYSDYKYGPDSGYGDYAAGEGASRDAAYGEDDYGGETASPRHPAWVLILPVAVSALGFAIAWFFYMANPGLPARIAARGGPLHSFLYNKWYFDELYNAVFVKGTRALGDLFAKLGDQKIIDGFGPNGVAGTALAGAKRIARLQSGYVYHYAFFMLIGVLGLALWIIARAGV